jgi:hypothetical protein
MKTTFGTRETGEMVDSLMRAVKLKDGVRRVEEEKLIYTGGSDL